MFRKKVVGTSSKHLLAGRNKTASEVDLNLFNVGEIKSSSAHAGNEARAQMFGNLMIECGLCKRNFPPEKEILIGNKGSCRELCRENIPPA